MSEIYFLSLVDILLMATVWMNTLLISEQWLVGVSVPLGLYRVILDEAHLKDLVLQHCWPPAAKVWSSPWALPLVPYLLFP